MSDSRFLRSFKSGVLWSWGNNEFGQLGDGTKRARFTPGTVRNEENSGDLENIIFGAASEHSIAVDESGLVWGWGNSRRSVGQWDKQ